jgi:hypothetical protein
MVTLIIPSLPSSLPFYRSHGCGRACSLNYLGLRLNPSTCLPSPASHDINITDTGDDQLVIAAACLVALIGEGKKQGPQRWRFQKTGLLKETLRMTIKPNVIPRHFAG